MAIVSEFLAGKLVTKMNYGMVDGKEVIRKKSYPNVKSDATIAAVHAIGTTITGLQEPALEEVTLVKEEILFDDGL